MLGAQGPWVQVEPVAVAGFVGSVAAGQADHVVGSGELALAGHVILFGLEAQLASSVNELNDIEDLADAVAGAEAH